ncbi:TIGR04282 family arsenosugar biosynthesis glycosyltransferase [Shimia sp. SDUM112013]|uniref:TIGR04282 family arsenosugar biosynthesis glycosyltransferase n=1 Tax=Shimia sp. SDUM112013 TaxID=3136160 RepID=UPI0032EF0484
MVKEPRPGRVKTRLGQDIGMTRSAWWFRHQSAALLRRLVDPQWDVFLAVSPDGEGMSSRVWPPKFPRLPQGSGDLGDRMARMFQTVPAGPVCIIGADIPGIQRQHIAQAFLALGNHDAVFGPAMDGGFWLTGLKRVGPVPVDLFKDVRWSTRHALADSLATLKGKRIAMVAALQDVDTYADLCALREQKSTT